MSFRPSPLPLRSWSTSATCRSSGGSTSSTTRPTVRPPDSRKMPFDAPILGVFASRAPMRPNPIGLTTAKIVRVDHDEGWVQVADVDAFDGTPILDMKGYLPHCDRVRNVRVPAWAAYWPDWVPEEGLGLED
ncbi:MAG: TrmO family methyltransferase [Bacteroidales bacterium]|nr:TrmO family methyltransferase [Bacteroidales bacterium]